MKSFFKKIISLLAPDIDGVQPIGRVKVGSTTTDTACFGHFDRFTSDDAALQIAQGGDSILKCRTSKTLKLQLANNTKLELKGDGELYFTPSNFVLSNKPIYEPGTFGGIHVHDASAAQSIGTGTTYIKCTLFTDDGLSSNCTPDVANDQITLTKAGRYKVSGSFNFQSGTANVVWWGSAFLAGVEQDQIHWKRKVSAANDVGSSSFTGIIEASTNDDLDFRVRHDNVGSVNYVLEYGNLNVEYLGETP